MKNMARSIGVTWDGDRASNPIFVRRRTRQALDSGPLAIARLLVGLRSEEIRPA